MIAGSSLTRSIVLLVGVSVLAGCAGHSASGRAQLRTEVQNLGWDVAQVESDLFVARLDVGEQRRRVRQTLADLLLARAAPASTRCAAVHTASQDAGHAADGVTAVRNDDGRVQVDLAYVARDVAALGRDLQRSSIDRAARAPFAKSATRGRQEIRTLESQGAASLEEAIHLRDVIDRLVPQANAICAA